MILKQNNRFIHVKVIFIDHKFKILRKSTILQVTIFFINEDLIALDQAKLRKKVLNVKEGRKDGKWQIVRNKNVIVSDRNQNKSNK